MSAGPKASRAGAVVVGRALQRLDVVFGLLEVGEVAGAGHRLHVAVGPGREPVVQLVEIGQLVARLVDLPVVGVAAHDDDVVGAVFDRHPGAHHRDVHVVGGKAFLYWS